MNPKNGKVVSTDELMKGIHLAYQRLAEKTKKEGGELVFADKDGNIYYKKASEL
jgi:hypothetical protein